MSKPTSQPTDVWLRDGKTVYKLEETHTFRNGVPLLRNQVTITVSCSATSPLTDWQIAECLRLLLDANTKVW